MTMAVEANGRMSALAARIAARERHCFEFEVAFLGLGGNPLPKLAMRVATKAEQDRAVIGAHRYVEELATGARVDAKVATEDRDIITDAKTCFILFEVCRDAQDPKYPAFPGPKWMVEHLSADELGVLLNLYGEVLRKTGTYDFDLGPEALLTLGQALAATATSDAPNALLARYTREQLGEVCIRMAVVMDELREQLADADKRVADLEVRCSGSTST